MKVPRQIIWTPSRRRFLQSASMLGGMAATFPAWADTYIDLDLPGGPDKRELSAASSRAFPTIWPRSGH